MSAGLLTFRLCDRDLECSACPLDRALRNLPEPIAGSEARTGSSLPDERFYHLGHTWVRVRRGGTLEVGLDDFGRRLLGSILEIRVPGPARRLRKGRVAFTLRTEVVEVEVAAPFDGEVTHRNEALIDRPDLVCESPFEEGWVYRAVPANLPRALSGLLDGEAAERWAEREKRRVRDLVEVATPGGPSVGPTLPDGGTLGDRLLKGIPPEAARRIIEKVFNSWRETT